MITFVVYDKAWRVMGSIRATDAYKALAAWEGTDANAVVVCPTGDTLRVGGVFAI